jgi:phosphatidylserine/phosphatidylglycerophosphate/cardiolipin synthase-like enzyme
MRLFNEAKKLGNDGNSLKALQWLEGAFVQIEKNTFRFHKVLFSPGDDIPDTLLFFIENAAQTIDLCVFTISDARLAGALVKASQRGIKVRIVSDDRKLYDKGSQVIGLNRAGIPVKVDHSQYHMHHKFGVIDGRIAFSGSYNWTYTAKEHNQENLIITTNYDIVHQYIGEFEKLWDLMYVI